MSAETKDQSTKSSTETMNKDAAGKTGHEATAKPGFEKKADAAVHNQTAKPDIKPVAPVSSPAYAEKK